MATFRPVPTIVSRTAEEQRARVLSLFRDSMRAAPEILELYRVSQPLWKIKQRIREEFEKSAHVLDREVIDILIFKGRNELVETLSQWKQDDHVDRFFQNNVYAQPERRIRPEEDDSGRGKHSEFLARFWEGNFAKERPENYA
ncbi:NADH dehydrogenase 1 alpha subcomplex subunit 6 ndufa6 [Rhizophlyctis rosea]|uniref:NADH dehydrogenase 1 alpha subcomplex subunit 6 ndufa6 n=1 Tax=Rhizophlyctis rosea TaxID=64517 RepID=A0AAD5SD05_9FUNG|nr:NADH dehydrogenase 1 alpha subcomplex subunit 6 ndufa6 [Rhizophlyctis rosea]